MCVRCVYEEVCVCVCVKRRGKAQKRTLVSFVGDLCWFVTVCVVHVLLA